MTLLDTLQALPEAIRDDLWAHWPDHIPTRPPWTPAQEEAIHASISRRTQFDADADPRIVNQAKARLIEAMRHANVTSKDQMGTVVAYAGADLDTVAGIEQAVRTLDRITAGELNLHVIDEGDPDLRIPDHWTVIEAGEGSELAHRRAVTDMTNQTGDWACVVTAQHPCGALHATVEVRGTAAHHIAKTVLAYTDSTEKENQT